MLILTDKYFALNIPTYQNNTLSILTISAQRLNKLNVSQKNHLYPCTRMLLIILHGICLICI